MISKRNEKHHFRHTNIFVFEVDVNESMHVERNKKSIE